MKKASAHMKVLFLCIGILAFCGQVVRAGDKNAAPRQTVMTEQQVAKLKEKWVKAFGNARNDLQINNDRESVAFAGSILDSLDQPAGLSSDALANQIERVKEKVRELVRRGALKSASILNVAQITVLWQPGSEEKQPKHPNHKTGGKADPNGLVLYMPFDTADQNGLVRDASGAGNDGRVYGARWFAGARFGGAYLFSITNLTDRIVIPNSDSLNPDYITVSAWIKTDGGGFWNRILDKHYAKGYSLCVAGTWNGDGKLGKADFECSAAEIASDRAVDDNQWHHVAATFDGITARCYVDGEERSRRLKGVKKLEKSNWDLCIGNTVSEYVTGDFLAFNGLIDEVRIYNRALAPDEIASLATASKVGAAEVTAKPAAAERLKQLQELLNGGMITKEQFDQKKKEIIDAL